MGIVRRRRTQGFSLVEVLVALFIAAIGVLGIAAIILFSLRASFESRQQSVASLLAVDVHERAWLSAHELDPEDGECLNDKWLKLDEFSPNRPIPGLDLTETKTSGAYPTCTFTVVWDQSEVGVAGGMFRFGGESGGTYTHNFTIPSVTSGD